MLQNIKPLRPDAGSESAVELLVACHERIRHFTAMVRQLAHAEGASPKELRDAAAGAYRYFTVALPLHEADEEDSLRPRMMEMGDAKVTAALDAMHHQHEAIDDLLERMMPLLTLVGSDPEKLPEVHGELCGLSKALDEVFRGHLELEETVIFPALPEAQRGAVLREMQERRRQG